MVKESILNKMRHFSKNWLFLFFIILFVLFVRVRLSGFPLERDEGEYAYMGQLILQGIPPYSEAYNMKFPGTYLMYAFIMAIFGQTIEGIHLGLMIVNCATVVLVFLLSSRIAGKGAALAASATYGLLSVSPSVLGFAAHATHFVVLPALGGMLALLFALNRERPWAYAAAGALFSMAAIMKQPGLLFALMGASYILWRHFSQRPSQPVKASFLNLLAYAAGVLAPLFGMIAWLYFAGVFDRFWFWTVTYASKYGSQIPLKDAFSVFRLNFPPVVNGFIFLWIIAAGGLAVALFSRQVREKRVFVCLFTLFSFLSVCPGFYFRQHYFVTLLPAVALLTGIFTDYANKRSGEVLKSTRLGIAGYCILIAALGYGIVSQADYLFKDDPVALSRKVYGINPFPESVEIARFIEARSSAGDKIAVFGSEPQILFYSKRHSATGYLYTYNLMENHDYALQMQKEMQNEAEYARPKFIVEVHVPTSWLIRPDSVKYLFGWIENYVRQNYVLVGIADIIAPDLTVYKWYGEAATYRVLSQAYLLIYERR